MFDVNFKPEHINAGREDFEGNDGIGRYIFFPGSDGRAKAIAEHFAHLKVKKHPRGHNLYMGTIKNGNHKVEVASVSSGMGTPSLDIIFNELVNLGAKRFLRVGTAGLLQKYIKENDFVVGTAAVRDEHASRAYVPLEYPAVASIEFVQSAINAAHNLKVMDRTHAGILHSKSSLYAREFEAGPMAEANKDYMDVLRRSGVIASEMEASALFVLASVFDHQLRQKGQGREFRIAAGAVCGIVGEGAAFATKEERAKLNKELIELSLESVIELSKHEHKYLW